jgi:hypothetical protein
MKCNDSNFNICKKRTIFPDLAPVVMKIIFLFSLKRARLLDYILILFEFSEFYLQRKTGIIFMKKHP